MKKNKNKNEFTTNWYYDNDYLYLPDEINGELSFGVDKLNEEQMFEMEIWED